MHTFLILVLNYNKSNANFSKIAPKKCIICTTAKKYANKLQKKVLALKCTNFYIFSKKYICTMQHRNKNIVSNKNHQNLYLLIYDVQGDYKKVLTVKRFIKVSSSMVLRNNSWDLNLRHNKYVQKQSFLILCAGTVDLQDKGGMIQPIGMIRPIVPLSIVSNAKLLYPNLPGICKHV